MAETSGINAGGGIKNLGSDLHRGIGYEYISVDKHQKVFKLRVGEIVHGTVLNVPNPKEALVRLPIGTMNAELHGQLKKGDSLLLRVESTEPSLVLKIYSVQVKSSGKELNIKEILRILDIAANPVYTEIVNFLKKQKSTVVRNEVLLFGNQLENLSESVFKNITKNTIFKTLYFINEANIKFSEEVVKKIIPVFIGEKYFNDKLKELINKLSGIDNAIFSELEKYLNKLKLFKDSQFIFKSFTQPVLASKEDLTFFGILKNVLFNLEKSGLYESQKLPQLLKEILQVLEGQYLQNIISSRMNLPLLVYIPIPYNENILIKQLAIQTHMDDDADKSGKTHFSFVVDNKNIGEVKAAGSMIKSSLNLDLFVENRLVKAHFEKNINMLKKAFINDSISLQSLEVIEMREDEAGLKADDKPAGGGHISIVI
jgi:hypothetical protein